MHLITRQAEDHLFSCVVQSREAGRLLLRACCRRHWSRSVARGIRTRLCCSFSSRNQNPFGSMSPSLTKCKHAYTSSFLLTFVCMCSYEISRKKARSKSIGEQQKLKNKVKKETKVCLAVEFENSITFLDIHRELLERSEKMLLSWLKRNYLNSDNCECMCYKLYIHVLANCVVVIICSALQRC